VGWNTGDEARGETEEMRRGTKERRKERKRVCFNQSETSPLE